MNTREMKEEDKEALQYMVDLAEKAEESFEALNGFFSGIFGSLGEDMMDSLVEAFNRGEDAANSFYKNVSSMLENLAKQMVYSVTLGPLLEKAQSQMLDVMTSEGLTDEQKFNRWVSILDSMLNEAVGQQDLANKLLTQYQNMAEEKGFDLFKTPYSQQASSGAFSTISQDTGEALEGRFTAIQINTAGILAHVIEIQSLLMIQINYMASIEKNTKYLLLIEERLEKIENNTSNL